MLGRRSSRRGGGLGPRAFGVALACLAAAGCSSNASPASSSTSGTATTGSAAGTADFDARVSIGDGRAIRLECRGTGTPTVVLISGTGGAGDEWSSVASGTDGAPVPSPTAVFPTTAEHTRVCVYDRPGTTRDGEDHRWSTDVAQPTTAPAAAADLHDLLLAAEVAGPVVLVGHSWGGFIATTYARTFPDEVTGLVLLDSASPFLQDALTPDEWSAWMALIDEQSRRDPSAETPDYPASIAAVDDLGPVPPIPVSVLTADQPWDLLGRTGSQTTWAAWLDAQARLSASVGAAHLTETSSGHGIQIDNPALVRAQICAVLTPSRAC